MDVSDTDTETGLKLIALIDYKQTSEVAERVNWLTTSNVMFLKYSEQKTVAKGKIILLILAEQPLRNNIPMLSPSL